MLGCPIHGPQTCNTHFKETLAGFGGICVSSFSNPSRFAEQERSPLGLAAGTETGDRGDFIKRGARK